MLFYIMTSSSYVRYNILLRHFLKRLKIIISIILNIHIFIIYTIINLYINNCLEEVYRGDIIFRRVSIQLRKNIRRKNSYTIS